MGITWGTVRLIKYLERFDYTCLLFKKIFYFHNLEVCLVTLKKIKTSKQRQIKEKRNFQKLVQPSSS